MKPLRFAAMAAVALASAVPVAAIAQQLPIVPGDYVEISMINVDDGHAGDYIAYLTTEWRKSQDFAEKQGWITGYEILTNEHKRQDAYNAYMATNFEKDQAGSAQRAKYRHQLDGQLLRSWKWRN